MGRVTHLNRQLVERIDHYFAGAESPAELHAWVLAHPLFANPKALDNSHDWAVSNALALLVRLADETVDRSAVERGLREARRFLTGETPFPEDSWPVGLVWPQGGHIPGLPDKARQPEPSSLKSTSRSG